MTIDHEHGEHYARVVAVLSPAWRVIAGSCGRQWILQHRRGHAEKAKWYGHAFCRTRDALLRCVRERVGEIDPAAYAALEALPARLPEAGASPSAASYTRRGFAVARRAVREMAPA